MGILFRTDASLEIGSGHVMRCITLADELRQRGFETFFVCRDHPGQGAPARKVDGPLRTQVGRLHHEALQVPGVPGGQSRHAVCPVLVGQDSEYGESGYPA